MVSSIDPSADRFYVVRALRSEVRTTLIIDIHIRPLLFNHSYYYFYYFYYSTFIRYDSFTLRQKIIKCAIHFHYHAMSKCLTCVRMACIFASHDNEFKVRRRVLYAEYKLPSILWFMMTFQTYEYTKRKREREKVDRKSGFRDAKYKFNYFMLKLHILLFLLW